MAKFRKKPVVIEAMQYDGDNCAEIFDWAEECSDDVAPMDATYTGPVCELSIETMEGTMIAQPDDWIICGIAGEFYACKPAIFEASYEAVDA